MKDLRKVTVNNNEKQFPGCSGEHKLQKKYKTQESAEKFYNREVYNYITDGMREFISQQRMLFIATSDANGECDSSFRHAEKGFVSVVNTKKLIYPEFAGNGVMASLGNISENPHIGMLFIDFFNSRSGLHINGNAKIVDNELLEKNLELPEYEQVKNLMQKLPQKQVTWVIVDVEEAYIHCSKNIPQLFT